MSNENKKDLHEKERRRHVRANSNFLMTYSSLNDPDKKFEISQMKNISKGGLCFVTSTLYKPYTTLLMKFKTPYSDGQVELKAEIQSAIPLIPDVPSPIYEIRVQFTDIPLKAQKVLDKIEKSFLSKQPVKNEGRGSIRIKKNFIMTYSTPDNPSQKSELSQVKNISRGGMCFSASKPYERSTTLVFHLRTLYSEGGLTLEGSVLGSKEIVKNSIYETRIKFQSLTNEAKDILKKIEDAKMTKILASEKNKKKN